jgi:hypothetical protein
MKDGAPFGIAGIWENWKEPASGEWIRSFAIITTDANELVAEIHDRMPVILRREGCARWLGEEADPRDLMRPFPAELMRIWPISMRVNKPENDDPSIIEPVDVAKRLLICRIRSGRQRLPKRSKPIRLARPNANLRLQHKKALLFSDCFNNEKYLPRRVQPQTAVPKPSAASHSDWKPGTGGIFKKNRKIQEQGDTRAPARPRAHSVQLFSTTRAPCRSVILSFGLLWIAAQYAATAMAKSSMPARCSARLSPLLSHTSIRKAK